MGSINFVRRLIWLLVTSTVRAFLHIEFKTFHVLDSHKSIETHFKYHPKLFLVYKPTRKSDKEHIIHKRSVLLGCLPHRRLQSFSFDSPNFPFHLINLVFTKKSLLFGGFNWKKFANSTDGKIWSKVPVIQQFSVVCFFPYRNM